MKKKILIDANPIVPYFALGRLNGIGRTCMELIKELDNQRQTLPFDIELFTQNLKGISAKRLHTGFKTHHLYLRNIESHSRLSRNLHLRELISGYDLQHITHNYEIVADPSKCIVTVHDAFFMKFEVSNFNYAAFKKRYPPFIRACRHIITPSEYSKKDIIETIGIPSERITVIPWGIDHKTMYVEQDKEIIHSQIQKEYGLNGKYFLSVSCDTGRKRTDQLIKAYLQLDNPQNDLVLVWGNPPDEIRRLINNNSRIHLLGGVSNDNLRKLYNGATVAFNPSAYEGFGLPILEAMACGCPIVTCHNSSLPEVGGDVAIYINEPISDSLPKIMKEIDRKEIPLSEYRKRGTERAALFSWKRAVRETIEVYTNVLKFLS